MKFHFENSTASSGVNELAEELASLQIQSADRLKGPLNLEQLYRLAWEEFPGKFPTGDIEKLNITSSLMNWVNDAAAKKLIEPKELEYLKRQIELSRGGDNILTLGLMRLLNRVHPGWRE